MRNLLYYRTGESIQLGDDVTTGGGNRAFVRLLVTPGTQDACDLSCPNGGVLVKEDANGIPTDLLIRPTEEGKYEGLTFVGRGPMFRYDTGEGIQVGDVVTTGNTDRARVKLILYPQTQEAIDWSCPVGGILVEEEWNGKSGLIVPHGLKGEWEDITFLRRGTVP